MFGGVGEDDGQRLQVRGWRYFGYFHVLFPSASPSSLRCLTDSALPLQIFPV